MGKFKPGLQKEVSRIFTGISIPGKKTPDSSGVEQTKADTAGSPVNPAGVRPAPKAPPAVHTPPVRPSVPVVPEKVVPPEPVIEKAVVLPEPVVEKAVVSSEPVVEKTIAAPRPAPEAQHLFTIPEPPVSTETKSPVYEPAAQHKPANVSTQTKSPVYEPPARNQAVYEPPTKTPVQSFAKHSKIEVVTPLPEKQTALLKIIQPLMAKLLAPKPGVSPGRQKATLLLIAVLPVILVFVIAKFVITPNKAGAIPVQSAAVVASVNNQIKWQVPPPLPNSFRDPMVFGAAGKNQQDGGIVVKGIVYSEDNPSAVVGDRIVVAGDTVGGAKIVKINPGSVEFAAGDKKWSQEVEH